jgi:hypothetical protein
MERNALTLGAAVYAEANAVDEHHITLSLKTQYLVNQ